MIARTPSIIGIDLGTACGWAVRSGGVDSCGTWDLSGKRYEGGGMRFVRFRRLFLELLTASAPVALVAYEEVRRHMGVDAAHCYGGLLAILSAECEGLSVPYCGIPVGTIKKVATGKGNADKVAMVTAAVLHWPEVHIPDDNAADALWCLVCGEREVGG